MTIFGISGKKHLTLSFLNGFFAFSGFRQQNQLVTVGKIFIFLFSFGFLGFPEQKQPLGNVGRKQAIKVLTV